MDVLKWIQNWNLKNCDGNWEHCHGISISTLDNPGWMVDIDFTGTDLEDKKFEVVDIERSESNWIYCNVSDDTFNGNGGLNNLQEILIVFQNLVEEITKYIDTDYIGMEGDKDMNKLEWIQNWYLSNCDGDWEHCYGVSIGTLDNPGWTVDIDLIDTSLDGNKFNKVKRYVNDSNWIICDVVNDVFKGRGDSNKLEEILKIFIEWAILNSKKDI